MKIEKERNLNGKFIDLAVEYDNGNIMAVEIELSDANCRQNIEDDLKAGVSSLVVACVDKEVKEKAMEVLKGLNKEQNDKVKVILIKDILKWNGLEGCK